MLTKVITSAVVIIPPEEKWASIQKIRRSYDRNIERWMPHITLLYPFRPRSEYSNLEEAFSETCKNFEPFEASLENFRFFNHGGQNFTLWLNPESGDSIKKIQTDILKIVPDCDDVNKFKSGFIPHLSVGQTKGKSKVLKVILQLEQNWEKINFCVDRIYFISREKPKKSKFKIFKEIPF